MLVGVRAVRAAAVGDDLAVIGKLRQALVEFLERDRKRALDVPGVELLARPDVDEHDVLAAETGEQLIAADRLHVVVEVVPRGTFDPASRVPDASPQFEL
jgi:hypothetical protein